MEAEAIAKNLMDTLKTLSETQSTQTRVLDKLSDGLQDIVSVLGELKTRVNILEAQMQALSDK